MLPIQLYRKLSLLSHWQNTRGLLIPSSSGTFYPTATCFTVCQMVVINFKHIVIYSKHLYSIQQIKSFKYNAIPGFSHLRHTSHKVNREADVLWVEFDCFI